MRACACARLPALRPDRALQIRIHLGPAPSLRGLRSGRGRLVRSLLRYYGQVRLLHRAHRRLRPPAFPTTSGLPAHPSTSSVPPPPRLPSVFGNTIRQIKLASNKGSGRVASNEYVNLDRRQSSSAIGRGSMPTPAHHEASSP